MTDTDTFVYVLSRILYLFVIGLWVLMGIRAILSWIPLDDDEEESAFSRAVFLITEPLIVPVRSLLGLFFDVEGCPVDVAFFITFMIIGAVAVVPIAV
ncbi:MAG: YggT family protein [Clostridia bacterium]|nr:YggT family protein [Clostridia bacterium]